MVAALLCDSIRKKFEKGFLVGCLYLDLSKAFDTMGHSIILNKLMLHGVSGSELLWFTDYLFHRTQTVEIANISSTQHVVTTGVPQGSILGPLLFIIFFNDLLDIIVHSEIIQYADDTVIFFGDKCTKTIENALNVDLQSVAKYCEENELILNLKAGKTEVMLLGTAKRIKLYGENLTIIYNNSKINCVSQYVYLGNLIDQHLNLSSNFDRSYKKASGRLRLLQSVRRYLTTRASEIVYELMILPLLTYSHTIKTTYTNSQIAKLCSLENRAAKIIGIKLVKSTIGVVEKQICEFVKSSIKKDFQHSVFDNYYDVISHGKTTRNNNCLLRFPQVKL